MTTSDAFKTMMIASGLVIMVAFPWIVVYGQDDEEKPKPMPPVPADYRDKHMPEGSWTNADLIANGEKIYQEGVEITNPDGEKEIQRCAQCHGASGKPKLKGARDFREAPRINKFSDSYWFWRVSEGVPKTKMPAWKDLLTEEQRWAVMAYEHQYSHDNKADAHTHPEMVSLDGEK